MKNRWRERERKCVWKERETPIYWNICKIIMIKINFKTREQSDVTFWYRNIYIHTFTHTHIHSNCDRMSFPIQLKFISEKLLLPILTYSFFPLCSSSSSNNEKKNLPTSTFHIFQYNFYKVSFFRPEIDKNHHSTDLSSAFAWKIVVESMWQRNNNHKREIEGEKTLSHKWNLCITITTQNGAIFKVLFYL